MGKENMKEPVPRDLPPMLFLGHLKEKIGSPYKTHETVCMIENPREVHKIKAREDERDMDVGWDITVKDVEKLRQFLTPTRHTLPNHEHVVQPYTPLGLVCNKAKVVSKEEYDYGIPLHDHIMQPLTPQIVHIIPPDDDYVALATNPILNKHLNKFVKEFADNTEVFKKIDGNPVYNLIELLKKYDCDTFIQKLLHQVPVAGR
uniref:Uncharacterized protein n=1 Tax=Tanacetum cinerariifolium TaxID=118510 RepID=A0A6L2P2W5_TANCI|nr:hypothetical protein [Tanacetum cinerariifolium]